MSATDRAAKAQRKADEQFDRSLDFALGQALADEKLWPLLQWLFYNECGYNLTSYAVGDASHTVFREGQRSVGYAIQDRANRVDWAQWQRLKAAYERPASRGTDELPESVDESEA